MRRATRSAVRSPLTLPFAMNDSFPLARLTPAIVCLYAISGKESRPSMKPAPFGYHRATSVARCRRADERLRGHGSRARRWAEPRPDAEHATRPPRCPRRHQRRRGAGRHRVERRRHDDRRPRPLLGHRSVAPRSAGRLGLLRSVVTHIGDRQVRNRGTIGGSLVQGDPTGEMPLACTVLDAVVSVVGPAGSAGYPGGRAVRDVICHRARPVRGAHLCEVPEEPSASRLRRDVPAS